jgi:hypothetical protein
LNYVDCAMLLTKRGAYSDQDSNQFIGNATKDEQIPSPRPGLPGLVQAKYSAQYRHRWPG